MNKIIAMQCFVNMFLKGSTGYDEVSERPCMWYVFEKRFSRLSDVLDLTDFCTQVLDIK